MSVNKFSYTPNSVYESNPDDPTTPAGAFLASRGADPSQDGYEAAHRQLGEFQDFLTSGFRQALSEAREEGFSQGKARERAQYEQLFREAQAKEEENTGLREELLRTQKKVTDITKKLGEQGDERRALEELLQAKEKELSESLALIPSMKAQIETLQRQLQEEKERIQALSEDDAQEHLAPCLHDQLEKELDSLRATIARLSLDSQEKEEGIRALRERITQLQDEKDEALSLLRDQPPSPLEKPEEPPKTFLPDIKQPATETKKNLGAFLLGGATFSSLYAGFRAVSSYLSNTSTNPSFSAETIKSTSAQETGLSVYKDITIDERVCQKAEMTSQEPQSSSTLKSLLIDLEKVLGEESVLDEPDTALSVYKEESLSPRVCLAPQVDRSKVALAEIRHSQCRADDAPCLLDRKSITPFSQLVNLEQTASGVSSTGEKILLLDYVKPRESISTEVSIYSDSDKITEPFSWLSSLKPSSLLKFLTSSAPAAPLLSQSPVVQNGCEQQTALALYSAKEASSTATPFAVTSWLADTGRRIKNLAEPLLISSANTQTCPAGGEVTLLAEPSKAANFQTAVGFAIAAAQGISPLMWVGIGAAVAGVGYLAIRGINKRRQAKEKEEKAALVRDKFKKCLDPAMSNIQLQLRIAKLALKKEKQRNSLNFRVVPGLFLPSAIRG